MCPGSSSGGSRDRAHRFDPALYSPTMLSVHPVCYPFYTFWMAMANYQECNRYMEQMVCALKGQYLDSSTITDFITISRGMFQGYLHSLMWLYLILNPVDVDRGSRFLQNVVTFLRNYTVPSRRQ